ncbi:Hypp6055 [Branchiostoma lanceolatum]|uniref:Hypp6055 protein n=1 Tax=Branchiostoma lanceolatum TaxID=7740 RepID=A0A8J9VTJ1_BRALA|nr:Hypp6055 [Branchiostoma lanceolatum]
MMKGQVELPLVKPNHGLPRGLNPVLGLPMSPPMSHQQAYGAPYYNTTVPSQTQSLLQTVHTWCIPRLHLHVSPTCGREVFGSLFQEQAPASTQHLSPRPDLDVHV